MNKPLGYIKCTEMQNCFFSHPTVTQEKEGQRRGEEENRQGKKKWFSMNSSVETQGTKNSKGGLSSIVTRRHFNASGSTQKMSARDNTTQ